ncbi:4-alpha-glucanotransferase [Haemophilus parainfluenzae]|uniref:4-alpha-glucanotransferase n=2 Tax=Haemophilus parainfluenzae TaxID=729 RepID=UPI0015B4151C|nr:4-alpha-glucanotransferase [Haemophilus parainfluenzae]MBD9096715.1 4-alpha-glucanotransferase [Haemophilus parainfluenzae]MBS7073170.1 4-alpha-glucanotransferase [Haemophilus parainfluenzae]QOR18929.1 4-alpha-glucanotransferase [Haemophilus parainfluenzae]QOR20735.1 4-alpha-glucanotransferase [Haemophilus parainfluenzae]
MQMSLSLKQSAEKLGISFSHYDIDGHLIDASPTSIDYFIEQLQFPPNIGQNQPFQNVICAFENEPIHDDLIAFSSPPDASLRYQLLDEQNQIQFEKTIPYSTALSFIACFAFYLLSFNAFCRSKNEKIQSVVNNQACKA